MKNEMKKEEASLCIRGAYRAPGKKEPCALNKKRKGRSLVGLGARTLRSGIIEP